MGEYPAETASVPLSRSLLINTRTTVFALLALVPAAAMYASDDSAPVTGGPKVAATDPAPTQAATDPAPTPAAVPARSMQEIVAYANCDQSKLFPVINANDIACFYIHIAAGNAYANCDGSTAKPLITANDILCFFNAYAVATAWESAPQVPSSR